MPRPLLFRAVTPPNAQAMAALPNLYPMGSGFVRHQKKPWTKSEAATLELKQAREQITSALLLIEDDPELAHVSADLLSIINAIGDELHEPHEA